MERTDLDRLRDSFYRLVRLAQEQALPEFVEREEQLFDKYAEALGLRRGADHLIEQIPKGPPLRFG